MANGEYNSLRSMGCLRPVSVLKLKSNTRAKYAQMGKAKMMRMLSPICEYIVAYMALQCVLFHFASTLYSLFIFLGTSTGDVVGEEDNCVVPREVLCEVLLLKKNGVTMEDIVSRLRCRTVPSGYSLHCWRTLSGIYRYMYFSLPRLIVSVCLCLDGENESLDDKLRSILKWNLHMLFATGTRKACHFAHTCMYRKNIQSLAQCSTSAKMKDMCSK